MSFIRENQRRAFIRRVKREQHYFYQFIGILLLCFALGIAAGVFIALKMLGYS